MKLNNSKLIIVIILVMFFAFGLFVGKAYLFNGINKSNDILLADTIDGDVNGDNKVSTADYILIRKHLVNHTFDKKADINKDGKITSIDYILVRKTILGLNSVKTYIITFNTNGGDALVTNTKRVTKGSVYGDLPTPSRDGYRFIGWFTTTDGNLNTSSSSYRNEKSKYNVDGNETLYAVWEKFTSNWNKYTINYVSTVPLKGYLTYTKNNKSVTETFFLTGQSNSESKNTFKSYINNWVDGAIAVGIKSVKFEDLNGNQVDLSYSIKYENTDTGDQLKAKYPNPVKNNDYYSKTVFISNDYLTLGISIEWGGSVTYLSGNTNVFNNGIVNKNIVNSYDAGREIQDAIYGNSVYNGNNASYCTSTSNNKCYDEISIYNPVQGGSGLKKGSKIVNIEIDDNKDTITLISRPLLWALNNSKYLDDHKGEYDGWVSDGYMYQTYELVGNAVRLTHSYIDFGNHFNQVATTSKCNKYIWEPHVEAPVIYTTGDLRIGKYNDITTGKTSTYINEGTTRVAKEIYARYAGLYNDKNQGVGLFVEDYDVMNVGDSRTFFHINPEVKKNTATMSTSKATSNLYSLYHFCSFTNALEKKFPTSVIVLGSYEDLEKVSVGEWKQVGNQWYYYRGGKMLTGWQKLKWNGIENWYYFDSKGVMVTGWHELTYNDGPKNWYYFGTDGAMATGWQKIKWEGKDNWFYFDETSGTMLTGWQELAYNNGPKNWYYFSDDGVMLTGCHSLYWNGKKSKYHFDSSGVYDGTC